MAVGSPVGGRFPPGARWGEGDRGGCGESSGGGGGPRVDSGGKDRGGRGKLSGGGAGWLRGVQWGPGGVRGGHRVDSAGRSRGAWAEFGPGPCPAVRVVIRWVRTGGGARPRSGAGWAGVLWGSGSPASGAARAPGEGSSRPPSILRPRLTFPHSAAGPPER